MSKIETKGKTWGEIISEYDKLNNDTTLQIVTSTFGPRACKQLDRKATDKWGEGAGHSAVKVRDLGDGCSVWQIFKEN